MDSDIAHELSGRKRKADSDEDPPAPDSTPSDAMLVDSVALPDPFSNAPRQPPSAPTWLSRVSPATGSGAWSPTDTPPISPLVETTEDSPRCSKRPRIEVEESSRPTKRMPRRQRGGVPQRPPSNTASRFWGRSDVRDMGIVPTRDPGPISGSLYRVKDSPCEPECSHLHLLPSPLPPINLNSPHIPVLQPIVNRSSLRELDLNAILRNPQLRHDLLFDSGLQFRPTSGRRKRDLSEKYWNAVVQELESECMCVSFDIQGKPHECVCVCRRISPPPATPVLAYSTARNVLTLRMPSRIRPLLSEFLDLLLCVIQPLSGISGYVSPNTIQSQMEQHATQASYLKSIFDPELIEQEIRHGVFDPSGLFQAIGQVLKSHCAPIRDRAVEAMVEAAQCSASDESSTKMGAVRAIRMCLDILELMKLDIANHQLQTLRPFLIETSGQFELKAFRKRKVLGASIQLTKQWLQTAHRDLSASGTVPHPSYPSSQITYSALNRTLKAYLCTLRGLTDLAFTPASQICTSKPSSSSSASSSSASQNTPSSTSLPDYPETTFLDSARLVALAKDAADHTATYMFLMLYRQLILFDCSPPSTRRVVPKVTNEDLTQLKSEIRDIASCHLGYCFIRAVPGEDAAAEERPVDKQWEKWQRAAKDVVLQIAMRATQAQHRARVPSSSRDPSVISHQPDDRMIKMGERWLDTNMHRGSPLSIALRHRLRDAIFHRLVSTTFPSRDTAAAKVGAALISKTNAMASTPLGSVTGMESLTDEIRTLSEKLSRLSLIHLGVYLPLYELDNFIQS